MHCCLLILKLISRKIPVVRIIITGHSLRQRPPPACTVDCEMTGGCQKDREQVASVTRSLSVFFLVPYIFQRGKIMHTIICVDKEVAALFTLHPNRISSLGISPLDN